MPQKITRTLTIFVEHGINGSELMMAKLMKTESEE